MSHLRERSKCALFAGMGLGKTVTTLTRVLELKQAGLMKRHALVLAPKGAAKATWLHEFAKWDHLSHIEPVSLLDLKPKERREVIRRLEKTTGEIVIGNYEQIESMAECMGDEVFFDLLVLDESTRVKNFRTDASSTKRALTLAPMVFSCEHVFLLTGTPSPNGWQDLWGQLWFLDEGQRLGWTYESFIETFFTKCHGKLQMRASMVEEFQKKIGDICLSVDLSVYVPIDQIVSSNVEFELPGEVYRHYEQIVDELMTIVTDKNMQKKEVKAKALTLLNKLMQISNGFLYINEEIEKPDGTKEMKRVDTSHLHEEKLNMLEEVVENLQVPLIVAVQYEEDKNLIKERFPQCVIYSTSLGNEVIDRWNRGEINMLVMHPKSGGHGLNLQDGGHHIVHYSVGLNLEEFQQVRERIGPVRQMQSGHKRHVYEYFLCATYRGMPLIDHDLIDRLQGKSANQSELMQALSHIL